MAYKVSPLGVCSNSSVEEEDSFILSSTTGSSSSCELTPCNPSFPQRTDPLKSSLEGQRESCCCVSPEELSANIFDQPLVGWGKSTTSLPKSFSCHHISSERSLCSSVMVDGATNHMSKASTVSDRVSKSSLSRATINLGSDSKSSLRSYIHSTPVIPYNFHHHNIANGDSTAYIEEYRNSYTYPNMEEKVKKVTTTSSTATLKPTLFVLDNNSAFRSATQSKQDSAKSSRQKKWCQQTASQQYLTNAPLKKRELGSCRHNKEMSHHAAKKQPYVLTFVHATGSTDSVFGSPRENSRFVSTRSPKPSLPISPPSSKVLPSASIATKSSGRISGGKSPIVGKCLKTSFVNVNTNCSLPLKSTAYQPRNPTSINKRFKL